MIKLSLACTDDEPETNRRIRSPLPEFSVSDNIRTLENKYKMHHTSRVLVDVSKLQVWEYIREPHPHVVECLKEVMKVCVVFAVRDFIARKKESWTIFRCISFTRRMSTCRDMCSCWMEITVYVTFYYFSPCSHLGACHVGDPGRRPYR